MRDETESGRWRRVEQEMAQHAFKHAADVLKTVAESLLNEELRERLLKVALRLDEESFSTWLA